MGIFLFSGKKPWGERIYRYVYLLWEKLNAPEEELKRIEKEEAEMKEREEQEKKEEEERKKSKYKKKVELEELE